VTRPEEIERLLRPLAPEVLGILARRHARFDACEDAVQEALLAAAAQWPAAGVPENPRAWLLTVASRRLVDELRGERPAGAARSSSPSPRHRRAEAHRSLPARTTTRWRCC
jgi:predicted RNA polymerase sigma factor